MTASQSCKSARHTRWLSTGHGRARLGIARSPQIVQQFAELAVTRCSFISPLHRRTACWIGSIPINQLTRGAQIPIAPAAPLSVP
jgi:hypothetical protein